MNKSIFLIVTFFLIIASCTKPGNEYTDGYESGEKDPNATGGSTDKLSNNFSRKEAAKIFPGIVSDNEARLNGQQVIIDLSKKYVPGVDIKVVQTPDLLYSTGMYAPAGEVITISVPQGVNGLSAKIGGWTDVLSGDLIKRDRNITMDVSLVPGLNYIRNLYGGSIYIYNYSKVQGLGNVIFTISGAVKSPDFILNETTDAQWTTAVQQSTVPWLQLRGKRIILELPKVFIDRYPIASPTQLMQEWDRIVETDIYGWKGLKDVTSDSLNKAPEVPIRIIMDAQLTASRYARFGFPIVVTMDENMYTSLTDLEYIKRSGSWRALHEIGFTNSGYSGNSTASWIWSWAQQPAADLYSAKMANRLGLNLTLVNDSMQNAVNSALAIVNQNLSDYISSIKPYTAYLPATLLGYRNAELIKLIPFLQIFDNYGYDLFTKVDEAARHLSAPLASDQQKIDFFYKTISNEKQIDFLPFFEIWGIRVSAGAAAEIKALFPTGRLNKAIYKYNPITKAPITETVPTAPKEINRLSWTLLGVCCEETSAEYHGAIHSFDYFDSTYWRTQWSQLIGLPSHSPHYMIIDMNNFYDVKSFWYKNPAVGDSATRKDAQGRVFKYTPDGRFTPRTFNLYFATSPLLNNAIDYNWSAPYTFTAVNNNNTFNLITLPTTYMQVRYIKLEIANSFFTDPLGLNSVSLAEFGVRMP